MAGPQGRPGPGHNRLLAILPPASRERLLASCELVNLERDSILVRAGDPIDYVYFPQSAVISLLIMMADGSSVESATIGFEGMVGAPLVLGDEVSPYDVTVQLGGDALRIPAASLRRLMDEDPTLRSVLLRYVEVLLVQMARNTACNRLHDLEERLARWLLHIHDWVWANRFPLTHDFVARMLGVRRPSVTVAARSLAREGLIQYRHGRVTIRDREGLEDLACEDYVIVRDAFERLLPLPPEST